MPGKGKKLTGQQVDQLQEGYAQNSTAVMLDEAFSKWETDSLDYPIPPMNRGDHILIGGRSATEYLVDRFNDEFPNMKDDKGNTYPESSRLKMFGEYYRKNGNQMINEMVSGALANGERVEVFVPDKLTGKIQDTPTRLTATGYEPISPIAKPAQLSRWKRFWGKLGFYKQEREQYRQRMQSYEAQRQSWQKVQFCNQAGRAARCCTDISESYRAELPPEVVEDMKVNFPEANGNPPKLDECNGFKTLRTSFYTIAIGLLAAKKDPNTGKFLYTNKQLYDMSDPKMQEVRAEAMKEVYAHYKPGGLLAVEEQKRKGMEAKGKQYEIDPALKTQLEAQAQESLNWLVDVQYNSAHALSERISQQAKELDFSRPDLVSQEGYLEFTMLSETAFDQSQDMSRTQQTMDIRHGKGMYWKLTGDIGGWSRVCRQLNQSFDREKHLMNKVPGKDVEGVCDALGHVFEGRAFQQEIGRLLKENPGKGFSDLADMTVVQTCNFVRRDAAYDDMEMQYHTKQGKPLHPMMEASINLAKEHIDNPEQFSKQILNGTLGARITFPERNKDDELQINVKTAAAAEREMKRQRQQTRNGPGMEPGGPA